MLKNRSHFYYCLTVFRLNNQYKPCEKSKKKNKLQDVKMNGEKPRKKEERFKLQIKENRKKISKQQGDAVKSRGCCLFNIDISHLPLGWFCYSLVVINAQIFRKIKRCREDSANISCFIPRVVPVAASNENISPTHTKIIAKFESSKV